MFHNGAPFFTFYLSLSTGIATETAQLRWKWRDKANCFFFLFQLANVFN